MLRRLCVSAACVGVLTGSSAYGQTADPLVAGFENPPAAAKPRVWWHWIDGNVSEEGIRQDLTWLNQIGVGGVQNFDAALGGLGRGAAPLVPERVAYLTPRWRDMFRFAVTQAQELGMEFTIAASPGWSESGGPWVKPQQGMKKLVWSETLVEGGKRFTGKLAQPPRVTGPFQTIPFVSNLFATEVKPPEYYADAAVVAYRAPETETANAGATITSSAGAVDAARLSDGDLAQAVALPYGEGKTSWLQFAYAQPQRIQSITASIGRPPGLSPSDEATGAAIHFEASDDGKTFRRIVDVPRNGAPQQTLAFAPTTARVFRLVLERPEFKPRPIDAMMGRAAAPPTAHQIFEVMLHTAPRVNRFEDKVGFTNRAIEPADDTVAVAAREVIAKDMVVDLTGKLRADGTLDWTPPPGRWVVLRYGYSLTGRTNHPASREGTGLEVDKLNRDHVKAYFDAYLAEYTQALGPQLIGKQGLRYMLTDSYEAGSANWTDDMLDQFAKRRGYDPRPWLPVLAGRVVVSSAASDRFLWDFRQTLADLIADAHYGELSTLLHEHGMGRYGESHESGRAFVGDGMQVKKSADVPMGALWSATLGQPRETFDGDIRESASVAHIYGQNLVAAESLTAFGNTFAFTPETLKPYADRELAMGLNRFVIHTSVHQPDNRPGPGVTLGPFGQWFTRHETWAGQAQPWVAYLARSSFLLQQGRFVADIAYLYGEGDNITNLFGRNPPAIPAGYNFDYVNADALINVLSAKDGKLVTPSGMQYRVLALDASTRRMSLPVLRKIRALVDHGVTVVGARPTMTPSLADDEAEFNSSATRLWSAGTHDGAKGTVLSGTLAQALQKQSIAPDCLFTGSAAGRELRYVHRAVDQGDLYFVASGSPDPQTLEASFRMSGKAPEIWRADTGERRPVSYRMEGGRTIVPLKLASHDAVFVVFRQPTSQTSRVVAEPTSEVLATVQGPWEVSFPPDRGAPAHARFDKLTAWTANAEPGIKYFSGTATYATSLDADQSWLAKGTRVRVNLGDVQNLAEVSVNGRALGVVWKKPFVVDVTEALRAGKNSLEVKVTNVWPNRMIGDKQPGAKQVAYSTFDPFKADSPLLPSGLLGPVTVEKMSER
jgi:alpha-L-rhamnosidase/Glycosyl hydrolases family 2, sugar binding domain